MKTYLSAAVFALSLALSGPVMSQPAPAATTKVAFAIDKQPLESALTIFARQAQVQILHRDEDVSMKGKMAPAVSGKLLPREALARLLMNSGLKYEFINERTVRITPAGVESGARAELGVDGLVLARAGAQLSAGDAGSFVGAAAEGSGRT